MKLRTEHRRNFLSETSLGRRRSGRSRTRVALLCATVSLAAVACNGNARAQSLKPLDVANDPNGVDLLSGKITVRQPEISVPGASQLRFQKLTDLQPILSGHLIPNTWGEATYDINVGGASAEHFDCNEQGDCISKKKNGSALLPDTYSKQFVYYEGGTGRKVVFDRQLGPQGTITSGDYFAFYPSSTRYPNGEQLTYSYNDVTTSDGQIHRRPSAVQTSVGYTLTLTYQSNTYGQAGWTELAAATLYKNSNMTAPVGRLTYSNGNTITDLAGRQWTCTYCSFDLNGTGTARATALRLPGESVETFRSEAHARTYGTVTHENWVTRVSSDGVDWNYSYVPGYEPKNTISQVTITAPHALSRTVNIYTAYQVRPRITSVVDSLGRTTSYAYDNDVRVVKVTYPEGNAASISYDLLGNITESRRIAKAGSGQVDLVETAGFSGSGTLCYQPTCFKPVWARDAKNQQTDYTWSSTHGGLLTKLEPADASGHRRRTTYEYDASTGPYRVVRERSCFVNTAGANVTCGTSSEQIKQTSYWGATFLPATETLTDGSGTQQLTTTYGYDAAGRVLSVDGPLPGSDDATYNHYDAAGRRTWEIGPKRSDGYRAATRTTFRNADDQVLKIEAGVVVDPLNPVLTLLSEQRHDYDTRRLKVRTTAAAASGGDQAVSQYSYDARNRPECTAVRMNPAAWGGLPASACTLGTPGSAGPDRITRTVLDAESRVLTTQKAYGTALQQDYATYTYSANGKQLSVKDANGNLAGMTYDGYDRQTHWTFPSKSSPGQVNAADYEAYGYDANGNRTSLRKRDGSTLTFQYDALNRVVAKHVPERGDLSSTHTRDVFFGYDVANRQTYARFDGHGGEGLSNSYDSLGRLTGSTLGMDGVARTISHQYDAAGNRTRVTHPDGAFMTYEYDAAGRLHTLRENGGDVLASFSYDLAGNRKNLNYAGVVGSYGYDGISRLTGIGHDLGGTSRDQNLSFTYNPASQVASRTISNDAYAWTGHVDLERGYAVNGLNQYTTAGPATFGYDGNGNLTSDGGTSFVYDVENRLVSASGGKSAQLRYDPLGRLYETNGGSGLTRFLYDGDALIGEYDSGGGMPHRYVHGSNPGADDPLIWWANNVSGWRRGLVSDHQGSVIAVTDMYGNPIATNSYDEYGIPGAGNAGRFQYTGQAWIPELGMYHYKARVYSPTLGRFLQTDPIGYDDQINLYAYVWNDPMNKTDPDGRCSKGALMIGGTAAVADGPAPAGDIVGVVVVAGSCLYEGYKLARAAWTASRLGDWASNMSTNPEHRIRQLEKGIRSNEKQIRDHEQKKNDYNKNPDTHDNDGRLAKAGNDTAQRNRIIEGRNKTLDKTIKKHQSEIVKKQAEIDKLKKLIDM